MTVNFAAGNATVRYDETHLEATDIKSGVRLRGHGVRLRARAGASSAIEALMNLTPAQLLADIVLLKRTKLAGVKSAKPLTTAAVAPAAVGATA